MQPIRIAKKYKVKIHYLTHFLNEYWFVPSDVLQRGIEANIWGLCKFKRPILDIGIGNGKVGDYIFKNIPRIDVGIDTDKSGLESAKKTRKYKKVLCANAENMPFPDCSFNTVVSNSAFEHIINDLKATSEVARILRKDGLFFTTVPSEYLREWILEYEKKKNITNSQDNLTKFNRRTNHLHYRSINDWEHYFKINNLEIIFYKYYFPKKVALFWYKLFKRLTYKLGKREIWSIIGNSKITKFIPKDMVTNYLKNTGLGEAYNSGFFMDSGVGAQLFMIVKKK